MPCIFSSSSSIPLPREIMTNRTQTLSTHGAAAAVVAFFLCTYGLQTHYVCFIFFLCVLFCICAVCVLYGQHTILSTGTMDNRESFIHRFTSFS